MSECESVRGEWGGVCPDCGQHLPSKRPALTSWKADRPFLAKFGTVTDRVWSQKEREARLAASRARQDAA